MRPSASPRLPLPSLVAESHLPDGPRPLVFLRPGLREVKADGDALPLRLCLSHHRRMAARAHREGAVSSAPTATGSVYKESLHRLLAYIGLENYGTEAASMPRRSSEEQALIDANWASVQESIAQHAKRNEHRGFQNQTGRKTSSLAAMPDPYEAKKREDGATTTVYLSFEETVEWRAFMAGIPANCRHTAAARRRLSMILWCAHAKGLCLYCWMPQRNCLCARLESYRAQLPADVLRCCSLVTVLLHAEELMRSTNSGHIAAFLLDAPLRVWGVPCDDEYLAHLPASEAVVTAAADGADDGAATALLLHTSLYPAKDAATVEAFIKAHLIGGSPTDPAAAPSPPQLPSSFSPHPPQRVHLILLDSTWPQAHSLNRHIAKAVPRVALDISTDYEARFGRLRKRTRESGVSTLEATSMAVEQCLRAMGETEAAAQTATLLIAAMEEFVDLKCLLKFTDVEFTKDEETVRKLTVQRDVARREEAMERLERLSHRVKHDPRARQLLLPPVANYCYCCDCLIGWYRMPEHVLGHAHRAALEANPTCQPSEASRNKVWTKAFFARHRESGGNSTAHDEVKPLP